MILKRYKKLKQLPNNISLKEIFTVKEYAKKRGVTVHAIYLTIDRVKSGIQKWNSFQCFQYRKGIYVVERKQ